MRKLLFYTVVYPGSIAISSVLLVGGLMLCAALYPAMVLPKLMLGAVWLAVAVSLCVLVQALARHWEV